MISHPDPRPSTRPALDREPAGRLRSTPPTPDPPSFPLLHRYAERVREHPDGERLLAQLLCRPPEGRR